MNETDWTFVVEGDGVTRSDDFMIFDRGESLTLQVTEGDLAMRIAGNWLTVLGTIALITSGTALAVVATAAGGPPVLPAVIATATSGAMLAAGIPLIVFSHTHVEVLPGIVPKPKPGDEV